MGIVVLCSILLGIGIALTIAWGSIEVQPPEATEDPASVPFLVRRFIWSVSLLVWTAATTAALVVGPAARLAMRVLAVTAGPAAQGRVTEADQIVGRISGEGTQGIFIFVAIPAAGLSAATYLILRRWLPRGWSSGPAVAIFLLVVVATRVDPLRADNPDFDLVGPGWLAILIYSLMALIEGFAVVAFAGRISRLLPLPARRITSLLPHVVLVLLLPTVIGGAIVMLAGVIVVAAGRTELPTMLRSPRALAAGRVVLALGTLVAAPGFVSSLADIAGRGPG